MSKKTEYDKRKQIGKISFGGKTSAPKVIETINGPDGPTKVYKEGRICWICGAFLTRYNPKDTCFCHGKELWV